MEFVMSALAIHSFSKMNGIGNEIVVLDLRDSAAAITPDDARAIGAPSGVPFDQLMVLLPPPTFRPYPPDFTPLNSMIGLPA